MLFALLTKEASYGESQTKLLYCTQPECLSVFEMDNYLSRTNDIYSFKYSLVLTDASILSMANSLTKHFKVYYSEYQIVTSKKLTPFELNE